MGRAEWERREAARKEKELQDADAVIATVDWHDFVIVETISMNDLTKPSQEDEDLPEAKEDPLAPPEPIIDSTHTKVFEDSSVKLPPSVSIHRPHMLKEKDTLDEPINIVKNHTIANLHQLPPHGLNVHIASRKLRHMHLSLICVSVSLIPTGEIKAS